MATQLNGLRKTAILLVSLGEERAARILGRLPADAIPQVRREMAQLGEIPAVRRREVFNEFCDVIDCDNSQRSLGAPAPFARLLHVSPGDLRRAITNEHPQTIAVILAYLPRELAGAVLSDISSQQQVEIVQRIAGMQAPDERMVREIERALEARLPPALPAPDTQEQSDIGRVLDDAERYPRETPVVFDQILTVDPTDLRLALQKVDNDTIALALLTASRHVMQFIFEHVAPPEARMIRMSMEHQGPARISDVEAAQQQIMDLAEGVSS